MLFQLFKKNIFLLLLPISFLVIFLPCFTSASDFMLSPAKVEVSLSPGESVIENLFITNRLDETATFKIEIEDIEGDVKGESSSVLAGDKVGRYSLKNYLNVEVREFSLDAGETFALPVGIKIPETAQPGGLYASILISNQASGEDALISNIGRIGALFFVRVKGEAYEQGRLENFAVGERKFYQKAPLDFIISYRNIGNVHLNPYGIIQVKNVLSRKTETINISPYFALPSALREIQFQWGNENSWGLFSANLSLNRGYNDIIDSENIYFFILPLPNLIILILLVIIFIILLLIIKAKLKMNKRRILPVIFFVLFFGSVAFYPATAEEMSSGNYIIQSDSINIAGVLSTTSNYRLDETIGETATGVSESTSYKLKAGYQQMQEVALTLSVPSDITMSPNIKTTSGGTSNGSGVATVMTDSPAGYNLTVKAASAPAMASLTDSFADYTPSIIATPDFTWLINSADSEFGFSVEGTDIVSKFKDNGSLCSVGALSTASSCWYGLSLSEESVSSSSSSNHPSGTATTIRFRAESGASHTQTIASYQATITFTALSN